jgi:hypothetical protein
MTCSLIKRMAILGFDSQKAVVKIYALMLLLIDEHPAPTGQRDNRHSSPTG